ncbi:MAG: GMC family oxidoreductase N-terminal domain-containing protein [Alphaproteobacteria bacterium]|nr:GMC family oxidoreductase N-terminal domain-containing protein [Alphaproteobacteria bacterium]MBU0792461.1 GMC family oxidoreductase N-terminal domain-containing protein [Alphaproteobacteria bacterium]MBU0876340.1 GMC family oxidoreductase N-terminal domain-containing protein [Alphaproteobacteria bacterium]MBU1768265.1 GMC family oxidoreductase N-terminal domain-containing protein [Alphaproteobacteria bacterium]
MSENSFDYVIVGAGSAGAVLAARLTEDPSVRVLLLEAGGGGDDWLIRMPLGFLKALFKPGYTWPYWTEPEPHMNNRKLILPRGRLLGGSSSINGMVFMRGHSADFDRWAQMGCKGWSYADVLPYFRKMERSWRGASDLHGDDGPLSVTPNATKWLLHDELMAAARNAGFPITDDIHDGDEEGVGRIELTIDKNGRRASTYAAYLKPAMSRPNLTVLTNAMTQRVLTEGKRATGVEYRHDGQLKTAMARREVILSGGTYNSPQLLMLSGIGPAAHLREMDIPVVHDLPGVGENLSEHPRTPVLFEAAPVTFVNELRFDKATLSVLRWYFLGTGPFARQVNSANPVLRTDPRLVQPDIQLWCNPVTLNAHLWFPGIKKRPPHKLTADVILLHPESRGRVFLKSPKAEDHVGIFLNLFSAPADFATARAGIRIARKIYATSPQAEITGKEISPGAHINSDEALDEHIRATSTTTQHPLGTCRMGAGPMAVVDPQLRVIGMEGLRVIDASVMPDETGGNINAPTIMIAERAADIIKGKVLPADEPRHQGEEAA